MKYNSELNSIKHHCLGVSEKPRIGIVTFPMLKAGCIPLSHLIEILIPNSSQIYLIAGNEAYRTFKDDKRLIIYRAEHEKGKSFLSRIVRYISTQLNISKIVSENFRELDVVLFFGCETLVLPIVIAKLMRKKIVLLLTGSSIQSGVSANDNMVIVLKLLQSVGCAFSNKIILYSKKNIGDWHLEKYEKKISIAHEHFLDLEQFRIFKKFKTRKNIIGYIGRLSKEKGIINFIESISEICNKTHDFRIFICGEGPLRESIESYIARENLENLVTLYGWVPHDELPDYLNKLKLLVLPSYTEGLPNIMLEAMACGTPILATPVGAIPDIIKDGETGFIMANNSPECIARNVIRALNHSDLERTAENARALVEREFTYEKAVERWREIAESI